MFVTCCGTCLRPDVLLCLVLVDCVSLMFFRVLFCLVIVCYLSHQQDYVYAFVDLSLSKITQQLLTNVSLATNYSILVLAKLDCSSSKNFAGSAASAEVCSLRVFLDYKSFPAMCRRASSWFKDWQLLYTIRLILTPLVRLSNSCTLNSLRCWLGVTKGILPAKRNYASAVPQYLHWESYLMWNGCRKVCQ